MPHSKVKEWKEEQRKQDRDGFLIKFISQVFHYVKNQVVDYSHTNRLMGEHPIMYK